MGSTSSLNRRANIQPTTATGTRTRNQRASSAVSIRSGTAAANAPSDPATAAIALYTPNPCTCARSRRSVASIGCSSDVNGPDSITSVDSTPVNAASASTHTDPANANTTPTTPSSTYRPAYQRRRPTRSACRATSIDISAVPATVAPSTTPTCQAGTSRSSRLVPSSTAAKP